MNKPHKRITISHIAREAGVSVATVSRAINDKTKVSSDTFRKIGVAMEKLGYMPQQSSSVSDSANRIVLLSIPQLDNPVFSDYIEGIDASAQKHGWHVFISTELITPSSRNSFLNIMSSSRVAGLISMNQCDVETLNYINDRIPVVQCMEHIPEASIPYVCVDDYTAAINAVEYLIKGGRRNIGMVLTTLMQTSIERRKGYFEALRRHGLTPEPSLCISLDTMRSSMIRALFRQSINNFRSIPDAFFCSSDQAANAALIALTEFGYQVPEDIAIIGFDDSNISDLTTPRLSTVSYSKFEAGYISGEMLYERFTNPAIVPKNVVLDTQLVIRQST